MTNWLACLCNFTFVGHGVGDCAPILSADVAFSAFCLCVKNWNDNTTLVLNNRIFGSKLFYYLIIMAGKNTKNPLLTGASTSFPFENFTNSALLVPVASQNEPNLLPDGKNIFWNSLFWFILSLLIIGNFSYPSITCLRGVRLCFQKLLSYWVVQAYRFSLEYFYFISFFIYLF